MDGVSRAATTMQACMLTAARTIERRVIAVPEVGPRDLLVRVAATGVCGSDLATYRGTHPYKAPPVVLGHELCGVVERTGAEVSDIEPGTRVCSAAFSHCEHCPPCRRGAINLCHARRNLCHRGWHGSFADYVVLKRNMVHRLRGDTEFTLGALVEPLAIGLHAARLARGAEDAPRMAIVGCGNIGLACLVAARQLGFGAVVACDVSPLKRRLAEALGASGYVDASARDTAPAIREAFGADADATIVCSGHPGALVEAATATAPGGRVVVVSYFERPVELDLNAFATKGLDLRFSSLSTDEDFATVIAWIESGAVDPRAMITHTFPLHAADEALRRFDRHGAETGKVMLKGPLAAAEHSA
jgi:2-desacetyl-2-hydroxyethyl bacteriochlorophyllide A dehydrogenase